MKRYRWIRFFVDTVRNVALHPELSKDPETIRSRRELVAFRYGEFDIDTKCARWLSVSPPDLCVPVEWHDLLREVESAYVHGDFYPALTSACCLGERVLDHLIIGLRAHFKASARYKEAVAKDSFQDWSKAISLLRDWGILNKNLATQFEELLKLRNPAVHFGGLADRSEKAHRAVELAYSITSRMFGIGPENFFICEGEVYIRRDRQADPVVKEFILPHCCLVGYKHKVEDRSGVPTIVDDERYEEAQISDHDFALLRRAQRRAKAAGSADTGTSRESEA